MYRHHQKDNGRKYLGEAYHELIGAVVQRMYQDIDDGHGNHIHENPKNPVEDGRLDNGSIRLLGVGFPLAPDAGSFQQDRALGNLDVKVG